MQRTPWTTEIIKGEPVQIGPRELISVVTAHSIVRRQVTFGTGTSNGTGGGLLWLRPTAVIEHRPDGSEEYIPISDVTGTAIKGVLLGALLLPILYFVVATLAFFLRASCRRTADRSPI